MISFLKNPLAALLGTSIFFLIGIAYFLGLSTPEYLWR